MLDRQITDLGTFEDMINVVSSSSEHITLVQGIRATFDRQLTTLT